MAPKGEVNGKYALSTPRLTKLTLRHQGGPISAEGLAGLADKRIVETVYPDGYLEWYMRQSSPPPANPLVLQDCPFRTTAKLFGPPTSCNPEVGSGNC